MIDKILFLILFAACQAASREPWWIQMFFPNVSFTGKYHPSNYKVDKSPLFPDYVQNPNVVWSPAYWMPYKQAYAQYWIDLIENTIKSEQETQTQAGNHHEINGQYEQNNQFGQQGQNQYDQYTQNQYDQYGRYGQNPNNQYIQNQNGQFGQSGQEPTIAEKADILAQQVQTQTQSMNAEAKEIVALVYDEAEKQKEAVINEANQMKAHIITATENVNSQAQQVSAQIDQAAKAKIEAISQEVSRFQEDVNSQFLPLNEEAQEIALEVAEIAEEIKL